MANPQTENGFTAIANEIIDEIVKVGLNGTQFKIVLAVWRYTYGFKRIDHDISLDFMAKYLNLSKSNVKREFDKLFNLNILQVSKIATFNKARKIKFNKDFDTWHSTLNSIQYSNPSTVLESEYSTQKVAGTVLESEYQERNINNTTTIEKPDICLKEKTEESQAVDDIAAYYGQKTDRVFPSSQDYADITTIINTITDPVISIGAKTEMAKQVIDRLVDRKRGKINSFSFFQEAIIEEFSKVIAIDKARKNPQEIKARDRPVKKNINDKPVKKSIDLSDYNPDDWEVPEDVLR